MTCKKGIGQWKHYLTTLQANTRSPGYGCYCIKYKQRWDGVKLMYQIKALLYLKFAVSNTSNKRKASRQWVEGRWRETNQIDQKSYVEACCIKYKQLAKGQKDNGRRETQQTINKQKNKSCLFVNLFGCFHDSECDIVQHFCWLAGLPFLVLGLKVGKCLKT